MQRDVGYGMQRWKNLFNKFPRRSDRKTGLLEKPTMKGNIVIVFTILISGLIVSFESFGYEATLACRTVHKNN